MNVWWSNNFLHLISTWGWLMKNWWFWTVVLEETLECSLDSKEIKLVNPKANQPWIFIGRTDAEAPILWLPMHRTNSLDKTLMLGKIEGKSRRGWQRMKWLDGITDSIDWVWTNFWRWWRTGDPGVLQSMELQRAGHDLVTEQQQPLIFGEVGGTGD